jgi:RNA polymerase sigma factor (sigma-70 family)
MKKEVLTPDREHYVLENLNLVHYCLRSIGYRKNIYEDLFQEGCYGLTLAAIRFDETKGYKFSTYAIPMITTTMLSYLRNYTYLVKIPRRLKDAMVQLMRIESKYGEISDKELSELSGVPEEDIRDIRNAVVTSLDAPVETDKNESDESFYNFIIEEQFNETVVEEYYKSLDKLLLNADPRVRSIYEEWFYCRINDVEISQVYLSKKYGCSQSYVSRIISQFNKKYKEILIASGLL